MSRSAALTRYRSFPKKLQKPERDRKDDQDRQDPGQDQSGNILGG